MESKPYQEWNIPDNCMDLYPLQKHGFQWKSFTRTMCVKSFFDLFKHFMTIT